MLTHNQEIHFSAAHRYACADWSEATNRLIYGSEFSVDPMGHNYTLQVAAQEQVVTADLEKLKDQLDHKYLNEDIEQWRGQSVTAERVLAYCVDWLMSHSTMHLKSIILKESAHTFCEQRFTQVPKQRPQPLSRVILWKVYQMNCVHQHYNPDLSDEENQKLYGQCLNVHGHCYTLEVGVEGSLRPCGQVMPRDHMDRWVEETIITPLNKSFINEVIGNASGERITDYVYTELSKSLPQYFKESFKDTNAVTDDKSPQLHLALRETRKNSFFQN